MACFFSDGTNINEKGYVAMLAAEYYDMRIALGTISYCEGCFVSVSGKVLQI